MATDRKASKLSVYLKLDGREVTVCSLEQECLERFTPLQIAQIVALASDLTGKRFNNGFSTFPDHPDDIVSDRWQHRLYDV